MSDCPTYTVTLTADQLDLTQSAVSEMTDGILRYRKRAHKLESTPEAAEAACKECDCDLKACNALWSLLEDSRAEQGRQP